MINFNNGEYLKIASHSLHDGEDDDHKFISIIFYFNTFSEDLTILEDEKNIKWHSKEHNCGGINIISGAITDKKELIKLLKCEIVATNQSLKGRM
jgi:hypothetical protein